MARLIPSVVDPSVTESEKLFLELLRAQLPANTEVYHNLRFRTREKNAQEGEADVVVLSPEFGMLILEVKGGKVAFTENRFTLTDGKGTRTIDPIGQCMKALQFFEKELRTAFGRVPVKLSYAIATPYTTFAADADLHGHERVLVDGRHMNTLAERLREIAATRDRVAVESTEALEKLRALLSPIFATGVSLTTRIALEDGEIVRLTTQQEIAWNTFRGGETRALVKGPAGTGKTVLALSHAVAMARSGKKTLLVCFNRALKDHLEGIVVERGYGDLPLTVHTIDSVAHHLCTKTSCKDAGSDAFVRHVDHGPAVAATERFDCVVVDEGQDITENGWTLLLDLLGPSESLVVFYDPSQELFDDHQTNAAFIEGNLAFPTKDGQRCQMVELTVNVRNAEPIVHALRERGIAYHHDASCTVKEHGVRVLEAKGDPWGVLDTRVQHLLKTEGVRPEQIVVLTLKEDASCTAGKQYIGGAAVIREPLGRKGRVRICSVGKFKGLEADIIVVVDAEKKAASFRAAWEYVAISRGKHRVFVVAGS